MFDSKAYKKEHYIKNKERYKANHKIYVAKNKEKVKERKKAYYLKNKADISAKSKVYTIEHADQIKAQRKIYRNNNIDQKSVLNKKYRNDHKEKIKAYRDTHKKEKILYMKNWHVENKEKDQLYRDAHKEEKKIFAIKYKERRSERHRQRYETEPGYKLNHCISSAISCSLKKGKSGRSWKILVGYTLNQLKRHLEKLFQPGMTWDNYGKWHVDHEIPISAFNFTKPEHTDFKKCWGLNNLQPMWAKDNLSKHTRIEEPFQPSLLL